MPYKAVFIYGAEHPGVFLLRILIGLYGAFQLHRMVNCIGFFLALCKTETPQKTALNRSFCKRQGTDFIWVVNVPFINTHPGVGMWNKKPGAKQNLQAHLPPSLEVNFLSSAVFSGKLRKLLF